LILNKKNILLFSVVAIVFAVIGAYFAGQRLKPVTSQPSAANQLFAQTLPDTQGNPQSLSQWKGKILLVNFWATWCPPCVEEMPELVELQHEMTSQNVQIIGIGIDSASNIIEFSLKHKIDYPLYIAGMNGSELSKQFGNQSGGLPFTVLVGPDGQVEKTYLGRLKMKQVREDLTALQSP
jgi:thiol-disulfide isomerase/thioredoxin